MEGFSCCVNLFIVVADATSLVAESALSEEIAVAVVGSRSVGLGQPKEEMRKNV